MEKFPKNANVIFYFLNHLTAASEIQGLRTVEIKKVSCSMIWNVSGTVFVDVGSCVYWKEVVWPVNHIERGTDTEVDTEVANKRAIFSGQKCMICTTYAFM